MAQITLEQLAHSYYPSPQHDQDYALKRLELDWEDGGAYALLGPSGCGKTTLLNLISGLLKPSSGRIRFDGADITQHHPEARNIAQVFQFPVVYDTMTVAENLAFPLINRGVKRAEVDQRVERMLEMLDMRDQSDKRARGLTADEKQKISLGRGLVRYDVNAILFDEPLTVIDPQMKWQLRTKLKELHASFGHTMIYVTHDQTEALTFADKVVVMYDGEVVQVGTPEELFERPEHTFVGYFIGSPGMNVIACDVRGREAVVAGVSVPLSGSYQPPASAEVKLGIRPEFLQFAGDGEQGVPVRLLGVDDVGRYRIARVALEEHTLNVMLREDVAIPSEPLRIAFKPDKCLVYADDRLIEPVADGVPTV